MVDFIAYMLRLILAALVGTVCCLAVSGMALLLVGTIEASKSASEVLMIIGSLGAFVTALWVTRSVWERWLRPRDQNLAYWREVAALARSGGAPSAGLAVARGGSVQLTDDGLSFQTATRRVDVTWSDLREIRIRTLGDSVAGPLFVMIKKDGNTEALSLEEVSPEVLARMQQLPGFRNEALIEAMGSVSDGEFSCWHDAESPR